MKTPVSKPEAPPEILSADAVEDYLLRHPDFFEAHLDLLENLKVPHPSGEAVSLVARQMELLRDKGRRLEDQLNDIVRIARDNDVLHQRIHQLTLTLLAARGLEDAMAGLEWGLAQYFQTDFVAVRIFEPWADSPLSGLFIKPYSAEAGSFAAVLEAGQPECGTPEPEQAAALFGGQAGEVASQALVPLRHAGLSGLLAIGSRDPKRFQSGMGALFLTQLGDILSARLAALVVGNP